MWVRNLGEGWWDGSVLGTLMRVVLQYVVRAAVIWKLGRLGRYASKVIHARSWEVGTGCGQDPFFLSHVDPYTGLLDHPHDDGGPPPEWEIPEPKEKARGPFYNLASKVTHHHICIVASLHGSHRSSLAHYGRTHKGRDSRRWGFGRRALLRLATQGQLHQGNWTDVPLWNRYCKK